jgi:hypothetical protein
MWCASSSASAPRAATAVDAELHVPTELEVQQVLGLYPEDFIHDAAETVAARLKPAEAQFLLASYLLRRPRVVCVALSDGVQTADFPGG